MKYLDYREHRQQGTFRFPVELYHVEPNHPRYQMPYHWHPEYEIIRIMDGDFHLTIDGRSLLVKKGDILFLQDGVLHGGIPEDCIYECLVFDIKFFLKDNHTCTKQLQKILLHEVTILKQLSKDIKAVQEIIEKLFLSAAGKKQGYELIVQGYLFQLFGFIIQEHLYEDNASINSSQLHNKIAAPVSYQHVLQFKKVLSFIEENYTEHITLEDMAKLAGMNAKYFCKFFREMSYRTPVDYLNYYRIECACEQLSTTKATIIEAAFNCGFNDLSYFIKTFRKYKGITPKQYLRKEIS